MPELPEVETVRRGLMLGAQGKRIIKAELRRPNLRFPFPDNLSQRVHGQRIDAIRRRGKYLLFEIGAERLIGHLGMSGSFVIREAGALPQKNDHLIWELDDGHELIYHDPRRFGFLLDAPEGFEAHKMVSVLGVEPLSNQLSAPYLAEKLSARAAPIKAALLDQSIIAGLGNIYVCEALFRAQIHPARPAKECVDDAEILVPIIRQVLEEALESGGSTLRNYATASGDMGYFQHRFQVYGREKKQCFQCDTEIKRIVQSGRSTFFCPACQPV